MNYSYSVFASTSILDPRKVYLASAMDETVETETPGTFAMDEVSDLLDELPDWDRGAQLTVPTTVTRLGKTLHRS